MKLKAIAIAALFSVAGTASVFAQATTPAPAAPASPGLQTNNAAGASAGTSMGAATDFDAFLQGFQGADFTNATSGLDAASSFNVVKLSTLQNADATKLQDAIGPHQQDIAGLSPKIDANVNAKAALDAEGLKSSDVVWIDTGADGSVTLYVNDLGTM